ncbi:hypothetical protein F4861DRAFT_10449 [Xylaria intraflava]|nr:hypothetical protein F4861DRAFT_10449 [Xylaria intraflava]
MRGIITRTPATADSTLSSGPMSSIAHSCASRPTEGEQPGQYKKTRQQPEPQHGAQDISEVRLVQCLSKETRRKITSETEALIKRRNTIDQEVIHAIQKTNSDVDDWAPRDKLLRRRKQLEKQEQSHLWECRKQLTQLERLYRQDPSLNRAEDYNLVSKLLWRFQRNLGPLLDEYDRRRDKGNNINDMGDDIGSSDPSGSASNSDPSSLSGSASQRCPVLENGIELKPSSMHGKKDHPNETVLASKSTKRSADSALLDIQTNSPAQESEKPAVATPSKKVRLTQDGTPAILTPSKKVRFVVEQHEGRPRIHLKNDNKKEGKASDKETQPNGK